ncbi:sensor histidine kinase [Actinomadura chibensis]|uniref:histidine kinase n=1 Tax=Actinomadura chibensis TaxID=392828 RepID=A0A5D0NUS1_9ACTN|nr:ATP-binding protein [Actinomadura chibensis]TYB48420.1 sensor histidine kinase [Actinomadura chibensis]
MPDFSETAAGAERRDVRRHGGTPSRGTHREGGGARRESSVRGLHLCISVLPAAVVAVLGLVAAAVLYTADTVTRTTQLVLIAAAAGAVLALGAAAYSADVATRRVHRYHAMLSVREREDVQRRLGELWLLIARGRHGLRELAERVKSGEAVAPHIDDTPSVDTGDPFLRLAHELRKAQGEAWNAVLETAGGASGAHADQRVDVFVNLARRMQSLAHRTIKGLDELENQVEDPDLLKGLFKVDHLSTRMRRQAESLAVIGGAASRRQWSRPVTVYEVLRSAIAEVEHYNRVKVVPPVEGTLHGGAVADIVHLLAELIENATRFAPPQTQVLIRVGPVAAGLAVEVEDRGLGIPPQERHRLNELLADSADVDSSELLQEGRIGLLVVSALARRHGVRVQLQGNLYGGTQAVVVVPNELVGVETDESETRAPAKTAAVPAAAGAPLSAPPPTASLAGSLLDVDDAGRERDGATAARPVPGGRGPLATEPPPARPRQPARPERLGRPDRPAAGAGAAPQAPTGARPELPRRQAQASLAPELQNPPTPQQDDQEIEHNPGLMAAFKRGVRGAQESDGADDDAGTTG